MRTLMLLLSSLLVAGVPVSAGIARDKSPEAKLARALDGRIAGEPVDCIYLRDIRSSTIFDRTAILYEGRGDTVYLNRPDNGANSLDRSDILVTDTHSSQLCDIDIVRLVDSGSRMQTGVVFLGKFVPYNRDKSAAR